VNKPRQARSLSELTSGVFADAFKKQGFASTELVTRWADIIGPEIAAHSQPLKVQWRRGAEGETPEPATLVLRVEGPMALEIQHSSSVILERVNRFFGWQAVGKLAFRQAPLTRRPAKRRPPKPDAETTARVAATLTDVSDDKLKTALARLGAVVKRN
jgi:hypothetical protein